MTPLAIGMESTQLSRDVAPLPDRCGNWILRADREEPTASLVQESAQAWSHCLHSGLGDRGPSEWLWAWWAPLVS